MENHFAKILLTCGPIPLMEVLEYAKQHELYEDYTLIKEVLEDYGIPMDFTIEDFIEESHRLGFPEETINNIPFYIQEAMQMAGYCKS